MTDAVVPPDPTTEGPSTDALVAELREARAERADLYARITEYGEEAVEAVADAVIRARRLLDQYEDSATGTGDFEAYLEFQSQFAELVEGLSEDVPEYDAFDAANEIVDQRRLSASDFARAREAIEPADEVSALLEDRETASRRVVEAERDVESRLERIRDRIDHLEHLQRLGQADLDAPTEQLTDPVARYDEAVTEAFGRFRESAPAREVLSFVATTRVYPFVEFEQPPDDLREYVERHPAGEEPIPTLLSYADYSRSKLGHYVEDTTAFRRAVPMHRTYLDRLDADPLTVGAPPPADHLRPLAEELIRVVGRFAPEETVALAREVRDLTTRDDYERLRRAAVARADLTDDQHRRLRSGGVSDEVERLRSDAAALRDVLSED